MYEETLSPMTTRKSQHVAKEDTMNYRDFGTTGIKVSQLVFGGGAVGGLLINQDDETKLTAIRCAMEAGINWIDTAPAYGRGRSEETLGWLLQEIDEEPYVSTKVGIDTNDLKDLPGQIERSLTASLRRLRRESVTLLLLHNKIGEGTKGMLPVSSILGTDGVLDGLQRMKEQGLIIYTPGSRNYGDHQASRICRVPLDELKAKRLAE